MCGYVLSAVVSTATVIVYSGDSDFVSRPDCFAILRRGEKMKIVVIKSPKVLSGILRMIFGIKKENA